MLHRLSLKSILIGGAVLAAVIPAVLVEIVLIGSLRDSGIQAATEKHEFLAKGLASEYSQFLRSHRQAVITLAEHAEESGAINAASLAPLLTRTRDGYSDFGMMAIVDPSGRIVVSDPAMTEQGRSTVGIDISDQTWFREIVRTRQPLIDPDVVRGRVRQNLVVTIGAPIVDRAGGLRGVVMGGLELGAIQVLADRIRVGETGYAQVATVQGTSTRSTNRRR